jgi:DNA polymerase-3 subunit delta
MVALKPSEVEGFLRRPLERSFLVLVYGPDDGLVAERARRIVETAGGRAADPFSFVRLDGAAVADDPARLIDEATTVSLFGDRRIVWVRDGGNRNLLPAVQPLLDAPPTDALVVIEAGDLKKGTGLRKKIEDHPAAVAIACWSDGAADLARLIDEETTASQLTIDRDARELLESLLGADRLASRGEIRKLCLYAQGRGRITLADVTAIVGDASAFALDELIDATAGGDVAGAESRLRRLIAGGTPASVAGTALIRHFQLLERARAEVRPGRGAAEVVAALQPPVFFRRREAITRQITAWSPERLARALALLDEAMVRSRRLTTLADEVLDDAVLTLARVGRSARRR